MNERMVQFFYLLCRDHLPLGAAEAILERLTDDRTVYSNEHLAAWARDAAARLEKPGADR